MKVNYEAVESRLMIVFEYCDCDLKRFIKENKQEIPEGRIKKFIRQLLTALSVLHDRKIIHRDIKPQNIMLDSQGNIKLADFGLARYVTSKQKTLTR